MSSEWSLTNLGAICDKQGGSIQTGPFGSQLHASDYSVSGIPVVMPANIGADGVIDQNGIARVEQHHIDRLQRHKLQIGDIVFSRRGDVTLNAIVTSNQAGWLCGTGCLKVRFGNQSIALPEFISYCLRLPETKDWLVRHAVGATMLNLNTSILAEVPVSLPPLSIQKEIASFLGSLDDRIALLRETNATLESIAQAIFKSWFIDFDPVKAKQQGQEPQGMDAATAALFPNAFQDSELGPIPAGWEVLPLGELVRSVGGGTPSTKDISYWEPAEFAWTTPKDLSAQDSPVLLKTERMISEKGTEKISSGLLPKGTLLLSSRAPIGYLAIAEIPLCINQGYIAMLPDSILPPLYMLFWCKNNMELIKNRSNGSTFMEISKKSFRGISAIKPPVLLVNCFTDSITPVFDRIVENEQQSQTLASIRDALLPRLISGKLRLPEAEAIVEEALG